MFEGEATVLFYPHYYSVGDRALIRGRSTARQGKPRGESTARLFMDGFPFNFRQDRSVFLSRPAYPTSDPLSYPPFVHAPMSSTLSHFNAADTRLLRFSFSSLSGREGGGGGAIESTSLSLIMHESFPNSRLLLSFLLSSFSFEFYN